VSEADPAAPYARRELISRPTADVALRWLRPHLAVRT
jgi:hypothetical protein